MISASPLSEKVAAKRSELAALMRRIEIVQAEVRVWEEAAALMGLPVGAVAEGRIPAKPTTAFRLEPATVGLRGMKGAWRAIMQAVVETHPEQFSLDQLEESAGKAGHPVNRNTARSQMSNYATAGLIERVRQGQFRVTNQGRSAAGISPCDEAIQCQVYPNGEPLTSTDKN